MAASSGHFSEFRPVNPGEECKRWFMSCRNEILMEIRSEMFSFFYFSASVWSKIFALIAYFAFHVFRAIRKKSRYWLSCQGSGVPLGCLGWTVGSFQRAVGPGALLWLNLCEVNPSTPAVLRPSVLGGSLRIPCGRKPSVLRVAQSSERSWNLFRSWGS